MKQATLQELASLVGGEIEGDAQTVIIGVTGIREAGPGQITFFSNPRYASALLETRASAVIIGKAVKLPERPPAGGRGAPAFLRVENPYYAYSQIARFFFSRPHVPSGISEWAVIGRGVRMGRDVSVHPFVVVGEGAEIGDRVTLSVGVYVGEGSVIGEESVLYPHVTVREGVRIGRRVIIHSGAVIGSDGFGYATQGGKHHKIPQVGGVVIEDDVEIGAGVMIDRAALGQTRIGRGTKIDNLVQVAHNVVIGDDCLVVAQAGIAGSAQIGSQVTLAGQAGVAGHLRIGDRATVSGQAGVTKDVRPGETVSGFPAIPHREWLKVQANLYRLPAIRGALTEIEARVRRLEELLKAATSNEQRAMRKKG
ncbi:MAG: UDP-3-O-(3-hydroxymyristoyl)glucosamine N-acyltransferase [Nitrospirae bacterium]|nr:UDP-3-O-(3-hydroxymyristoyl)glucosamine N-acyltransferase [Nitrospirota bacterium]